MGDWRSPAGTRSTFSQRGCTRRKHIRAVIERPTSWNPHCGNHMGPRRCVLWVHLLWEPAVRIKQTSWKAWPDVSIAKVPGVLSVTRIALTVQDQVYTHTLSHTASPLLIFLPESSARSLWQVPDKSQQISYHKESYGHVMDRLHVYNSGCPGLRPLEAAWMGRTKTNRKTRQNMNRDKSWPMPFWTSPHCWEWAWGFEKVTRQLLPSQTPLCMAGSLVLHLSEKNKLASGFLLDRRGFSSWGSCPKWDPTSGPQYRHGACQGSFMTSDSHRRELWGPQGTFGKVWRHCQLSNWRRVPLTSSG